MGLNAVTDVVIMLSFGTFFPPLTWLIILCMLKDMAMYRLLLHRWNPWFASKKTPQIDRDNRETGEISSQNNPGNEELEHKATSFDGLNDEVANGLFIAVLLSSMIWCLVMFDIVGNKEGINSASIAMVVVLGASPWPMSTLKWLFACDRQNDEDENDVEMLSTEQVEVKNPIL